MGRKPNIRKPNILFLFSDQHNAKCLSCSGHAQVRTPNLDRLAAQGCRFEQAYTVNPICTPSRVSFLSGVYPSAHGYYGLYGAEPASSLTSLFRHFRSNGYRTGALGKLHTPRYWIERDCQFVYDEFVEYPKYLEGAGLYEKNDNRNFTGNRDGEASALPFEHSCESALAQQTVRFLRNEGEPKDRGEDHAPWLAWVSFSRPHQPYTPSRPFADMYPPETVALPPVADGEKKEVLSRRSATGTARLRQLVSAYYGLVSQVDHAIGMIMQELERSGELENTIIVYSSDHGDYAGEHGLIEKKGGISYRAITNIPLIVRLPANAGFPRRHVSDAIIESIDVFPTLCELSGNDIPDTVQGRSFASILRGEPSRHRDSALTENAYRKSLTTKAWRYVANLHPDQSDELYSMEDDPWELRNRIDDPSCADRVNILQRQLLDRVVRASKPVTVFTGGWHNHRYDRDGRAKPHHNNEDHPYW